MCNRYHLLQEMPCNDLELIMNNLSFKHFKLNHPILIVAIFVSLFISNSSLAFGQNSMFNKDFFSEGSLILGYKRNNTFLSQQSDFDGYSRFEGSATSTESLNPFVTYKSKPFFILDSKFIWGVEATYGVFALNNFHAINYYDNGNELYIGGDRVTEIENKIEYENDIRGEFLYVMPSISYMVGKDDFYLTFGAGYGLGRVGLQKQSTKAEKHIVKLTYADGHSDSYSLAEFGATYSSPFDDTNGFTGAFIAFLEMRLWFIHFSLKQGGVQWIDDKTENTLENPDYTLGILIDF